MTTMSDLGDAKYISLTSFRKDGTAVATPVWVARDGDALVVWTVTKSYKIKRIQRNGSVTVAPCTIRGELLGPAVPGRATIMDASGTQRVRELIKKKYGVTGWLTVNMSALRRGRAGTVGLRVVLD